MFKITCTRYSHFYKNIKIHSFRAMTDVLKILPVIYHAFCSCVLIAIVSVRLIA